MSKSKKIISVISLFTILCLVTGMAGCNKPHNESEIKKYVEDNVPEEATLIHKSEDLSGANKEYVYTFESDSRNLQFNIYSVNGYSSLVGYQISNGYRSAIYDYYLDKIKPSLASCPNSEVYLNPGNQYTFNTFYIDTESDARAVAKVLEDANDIVTEQWEYQPGEDLTDTNVLGLKFFIYSETSNTQLGTYCLNGKDDEDVIYNKLKGMLP